MPKHTEINCFQVLCGSSVQITMLTHTLRQISWMYQQWNSRCGHSDFDFSPFSIAGFIKSRLERPCHPQFVLSASLLAIKTNMRVRNSLFWHIYSNTSGSKIVDNVTQKNFVTIFIWFDWQLSCILSLTSKLSVADSWRFFTPKKLFWGSILNLWQLEDELQKIIFVACRIFWQLTSCKWP